MVETRDGKNSSLPCPGGEPSEPQAGYALLRHRDVGLFITAAECTPAADMAAHTQPQGLLQSRFASLLTLPTTP